jgi:hypothetical protein
LKEDSLGDPAFELRPDVMRRVRWSRRGSCGMSGCSDPECCCSLCRRPVGVAEDDPRWATHDEDCADCELCRDQVPLMLFRGQGKEMEQAIFHNACFEQAMMPARRKRHGIGAGEV